MRGFHLIITLKLVLFSASCMLTSGALSVVPPTFTANHKTSVASTCPSVSLSASKTTSSDENSASFTAKAKSRILSFFEFDKVVDPYHLIWSPGFVKKMATTTILLFTTKAVLPASTLSSSFWTLPPVWQSFASTIGLPLLASACCVLQLVINVVAGGCAGFNTVLGPVRPFFMALLLFLSVISNNYSTITISNMSSIRTLAIKWSIALLPEGLHLFNKLVLESARIKLQSMNTLVSPVRAQVELDIPTMGCVACINSIDNALLKTKHVLQASASLHKNVKGGKAIVEVGGASEKEIQDGVDRLCAAVEKAGFGGCTVKTVTTLTT